MAYIIQSRLNRHNCLQRFLDFVRGFRRGYQRNTLGGEVGGMVNSRESNNDEHFRPFHLNAKARI